MHVKPEVERFAKIRVVGVGGAGCNVLNSMILSKEIVGVEFIAVNTDAQALSVNEAFIKVPLGTGLTNGLGAGSDPEIGRKSAEESRELLKSHLDGADMVFVTAGMGGGTGTGAASIVAKIARELGALTIGVVTKPFNFEGSQRRKNAEIGINALKKEVDALITIPNQKLLEIADDTMSIKDAFKLSDSILNQGVQGIADLIVLPGLINVDFADVRTIMKDAGSALMGIGIGTGKNRAEEAARAAISSPLLDESIENASGILFNITGGEDITMKELDRAAEIIREISSEGANIIFGASVDPEYNDKLKITVIATGFDSEVSNFRRKSFVSQTATTFNTDETLDTDNVSNYSNIESAYDTEDDLEVEEYTEEELVVQQGPTIDPLQNTSNPIEKETSKEIKKEEDVSDLDKNYDKTFDIPAFLRGGRKK